MKKSFQILGIIFACTVLLFGYSAKAGWNTQTSETTNNIAAIDFLTDSIGGYLASAAADNARFTSDGGESWGSAVSGVNTGINLSMYGTTSSYTTYAIDGSMSGKILKSTNGGAYSTTSGWYTTVIGDACGIKAVSDQSTVFASSRHMGGTNLGVAKTIDGGTNWTNEFEGTDSHASSTCGSIDCLQSGANCVAVGSAVCGASTAAYSVLGSWTESTTTSIANVDYLYDVSMPDANTAYAVGKEGSDPVIYKSTDGGDNWTEISTHGKTGIGFNGVDFIDANTGWVVGDANGGAGTIIYTSDGGDSWTSQDGGTSNSLNSVNAYSAWNVWAGGDSGTILYFSDSTAPTTTADPSGGTYTETQTVTLSVTDSESGVDATYYTTDGTDPTTGSSAYSTPLEISETTTLKFFSTDNAGNSESINTETYTINIPTPTNDAEDYAGRELKIKDIELEKTYHNTKNNTDFFFYRKPIREYCVRKKLYIKVLRKSGYKKAFKKKKAFKTHYKLKLNVGKAKKATWPNVKKRMKYKVALRYTDAQLAKKQGIKEKKLRLFIKDRKNLWRGPYTVYQNRSTNTFKFKIRNFKHLNELASISSTNRTFSPTFYFRNLKKVRFVIATKKAFRKNYPFNLADQNNYNFE